VAEDTKYEIVLLANTKAGIQRIFERILSSGLRARPRAIQHDSRSLVDLHRSGLATVLVDTSGLRSELPAVAAGNRAGGAAAGRHPAGLGHRRAGSVLGATELMTRDRTSQISEAG
jgi:DNA-binding LacI/PurR family transcriptional regulator